MTDRVPRVFLASSSEGLPTAEALKALLEPAMSVQLWNDGFFSAGQFTLEALEAKGRSFDAAIVLGTADDRVTSRSEESDALRDNLLLEFGFFVALLGRRRALLALEHTGSVKVPSDLFGLTCVSFTKAEPAEDGLKEAADEIKTLVAHVSAETVSRQTADALEAILRTFMSDLQDSVGAPSMGFHVWVVDHRLDPPRLVRVARSRTMPKAQDDRSYAEGEGVVGECWRTGVPAYVDFTQEPYKSVTRATWEAYGPDARLGMSFEMLDQSRVRHLAVGASPIRSSIGSHSDFLGCLSFNANRGLREPSELNRVRARTEEVLDRASELCRIVLEPSNLSQS